MYKVGLIYQVCPHVLCNQNMPRKWSLADRLVRKEAHLRLSRIFKSVLEFVRTIKIKINNTLV